MIKCFNYLIVRLLYPFVQGLYYWKNYLKSYKYRNTNYAYLSAKEFYSNLNGTEDNLLFGAYAEKIDDFYWGITMNTYINSFNEMIEYIKK